MGENVLKNTGTIFFYGPNFSPKIPGMAWWHVAVARTKNSVAPSTGELNPMCLTSGNPVLKLLGRLSSWSLLNTSRLPAKCEELLSV